MAIFCHLLSSNPDCEVLYFVPMMQVLILAPFVIFVVVIIMKLIQGGYKLIKKTSQETLLAPDAHISHPPQPIQPIATYRAINN
jgi:hypothetical protein